MKDPDFSRAWESWHEARLRATMSPRGLAALAATHWLTGDPAAYDGVPGLWNAAPDGIVGAGADLDGLAVLQDGHPLGVVSGGTVTLARGQDVEWGEKRLRYFDRDGSLALRLYDPAIPTRSLLRGIDAFEPTEEWVVDGRFVPAGLGERIELTAIDGYVGEEIAAGTVEFELDGEPVRFAVTGGPNGLKAIFGDATNGDETYPFRFLTIRAPDADGHVDVDFNRAYLPPCAFSDFYVCQLPPPGNRLVSAVRAGEKAVVLAV